MCVHDILYYLLKMCFSDSPIFFLSASHITEGINKCDAADPQSRILDKKMFLRPF